MLGNAVLGAHFRGGFVVGIVLDEEVSARNFRVTAPPSSSAALIYGNSIGLQAIDTLRNLGDVLVK